jgi:hypothetical protein
VLATGFSLLLGLIVFLAFTSYDDSKAGAESEVFAVVQQFETAQFLPPAARGELICYGRSVVARRGRGWRPTPRAGVHHLHGPADLAGGEGGGVAVGSVHVQLHQVGAVLQLTEGGG